MSAEVTVPGRAQVPAAIAEATAEQPGARAALAAALRSGPSHAYVFVGPAGSGKAAAARALAAELLARGVDDPEEARRRALADPSPHPDLTWLRPPGNQHLVDEVRREIIASVPYRPFEAGRRVFVIEAADAMAEESQNALLKTLEEPPDYAHLILITTEPSALLETVRSRCQRIDFAPLAPAVLAGRLADELPGMGSERLEALALLSGGDIGRARLLGSPTGERLRAHAEGCARAAVGGDVGGRPWIDLLKLAAERGKQEGAAVAEAAEVRAGEAGGGRDSDRVRREGGEAAKRADRRARTEAVDLALGLVAAWFTDVVAVAEGAPELVRNTDRAAELSEDSAGVDPGAAGAAARLAMQTRGRLRVNVGEELALEALFHRAARALGQPDGVL
ncbi:MAG: AAA family ATPase [Solirubrobacterales bacterium]